MSAANSELGLVSRPVAAHDGDAARPAVGPDDARLHAIEAALEQPYPRVPMNDATGIADVHGGGVSTDQAGRPGRPTSHGALARPSPPKLTPARVPPHGAQRALGKYDCKSAAVSHAPADEDLLQARFHDLAVV